MRVAVISDDLTGAADTGVQLARAGYRTAVAFGRAPEPADSDIDALVIDTDSRALDPAAAAERVAAAVADVAARPLLYKKLDSTLRGPVAAELRAALAASGRVQAIVAPAFPASGRTTRGGTQLVHGEPVERTAFADDPGFPVRESHLPSLLAAAGLGRVSVVDSDSMREAGDAPWVVVDAEADADLERIVRAVPDPAAVLWAGSAGLALALGRVYPGPRAHAPGARRAARRVLVVVGSANAAAREQLERLAAGPEPVALVELEPAALSADHLEGASSALGAALDAGGICVLAVAAGSGDGERITQALAEVVGRLSDGERVDGLVLTGGATAIAVARRLGAHGLVIEDELEPGVPIGRLLGPAPHPVVTKAGGFGTPDALRAACRALRAGA